jgi:hypothetical protein
MQHGLIGRVRAAFVGGGASLILAMATLAAPAMAADEPAPTPKALTSHTHQLRGTVKAAVSSGAKTVTVSTKRYGDVTVAFDPTAAGAAAKTNGKGKGEGRGKARAHDIAALSDLKAGERVVVLGRTSEDGKSFTARRVHLLPAKDAE